MKLSDKELDIIIRYNDRAGLSEALTELQAWRKLDPWLSSIQHYVYCEYYQVPPNGTCTCGLDAIRKELEKL